MAYDNDKPMYVWPVDMKGPDGNSFVMISHGIKQLRAFGATPEFVKTFQEEATSGDHEKVKATIKTFFNVVVPTTTFALLEEEEEL